MVESALVRSGAAASRKLTVKALVSLGIVILAVALPQFAHLVAGAAMLFLKAGIAAVYAETLSEGGLALLEEHHIPVRYDTLTPSIRNRDNTGICPMEQAVAGITEIEDGAMRVMRRLDELRSAHH